jgi:tetratricopeptide (TPR) repeat protein
MLTVLALMIAAAEPLPGDAAAAPPGASAPAPTRPLAALVAAADEGYDRRDDPGALARSRAALDEAARIAPDDYGVLWRLARHEVWLAEDPALPKERKSELGRIAWELGERAVRSEPGRVEGWFYATAGMGNYALGIGVLTALTKGIEGKFKDRLAHAEAIDPDYLGGAVFVAWGRFWFELPWPKFDAERSERSLAEALRRNPDDVRAWVYLGDLHLDRGRRERAADAWRKAIARPPGRYDAPEERRWQEVARRSLEKLGERP